MKVIVCVDNAMGVAFNGRRQSQDKILNQKLVERFGRLHVNKYSSSLFHPDDIIIDDDFMAKSDEDYYLVECNSLKEIEAKISELIVCYWNRDYPSDMKLEISKKGWKVRQLDEFAGSSHDKIVIEKWTR